ncbi:MAG: AraC family transcriptional regulator, partial [Oscillospiraceae bacterium]
PYDALFNGINQIRLFMLLFNVIAVVSIMLLLTVLARRIYQPVNSLMKNIDIPLNSDGNVAEFERLEQSYLFSKEELRQLETEKAVQGVLVREYALKNLFSTEHALTREELKRLNAEHQITLDFDVPISMILLKIDNFSNLNPDYDQKSDRSLVLFAIKNIISEIFSETYVNECVWVSESCIALLYNTCSDDELSTQLLKKVEKIILQLFSLSFCASIEENFDAVTIPKIYELSINSLNDRFMLGENCIVTKALRERTTLQIFVDYNFDEETTFLDSFSQMKLEPAQKSLDKLILKMKSLDFQSACIATSHLTTSIQQAIFEINKYRKEPIAAKEYIQSLEQSPTITLNQYHHNIKTFLTILQQNYLHGSSKHQILAETIKDYIDKMYDSYDLSATTVADILKISSAHAGRVFNLHMGMSIPEYINCVRLKKAMEWMQNSDFTIQEIMSKVGYQNESYFYKVFKERFQFTPRAYVKSLHTKR